LRIELRLFATLSAYLPAGAQGDTAEIDLPEGATVADVIHQLRIPGECQWVAAVNGLDAAADRRLTHGDVLALFPPLAGGSLSLRPS
jgi:sulfur-carrier protein